VTEPVRPTLCCLLRQLVLVFLLLVILLRLFKVGCTANEEKSCAYLTHVNHEADSERSLARQKISNAGKRKTTEDLFERPAKIIQRVMTTDALEVLMESDITQIRKAIHGARRQN
jgi:hypothetical protein